MFKLWEGLGYYSRCRNLITTAKYIHGHLQNAFPSNYEDILQLKGVGPYTAAAIASFAFNLPHAVIDGNVFRILSRVFGVADAIDSTQGKNKFKELAAQLLDKNKPGTYNQAIMDFGATVCKPVAPLCEDCIFKSHCVAFTENKVLLLPVKEKKVKQRTRFFYFFVIKFNNKIAVRERTEKDIWRHLHEFPLVEMAATDLQKNAIASAFKLGWIHKNEVTNIVKKTYTQKLTHQHITAFFIESEIKCKSSTLTAFEWIKPEDLKQISFPRILNDYLSDDYIFQS
ncbi:A/G-specific adenine glycosylase [Niabella ginsengisoli]|uniref:Adenine DNA glycosylase n=1 Tax=Niabella ginsengisoli TaxID=522298 RepID=A0ABS9SQ37_9BACT|nr:NUDIX domain-containing protein [Niabella ginsengisoli]MCH5600496.1 NUDIX domain-containing protein [Niabella ginsengisoli]